MLDLRPVYIGNRTYLDQRYQKLEEMSFESFSIEPLSVALGAKITLSNDNQNSISNINAKELYGALLFYKLLVFDDLVLTDNGLLEIASMIERSEMGEQYNKSHHQVIHVSTDKYAPSENVWHIDGSWNKNPPAIKMLYADIMPKLGGGTMFCNLAACYESLDDSMKARINKFHVVHDVRQSFKYKKNIGKHPNFPSEGGTRVHPLVKTHPITGEKILYVNTAVMSSIIDLDAKESEELLCYLVMQQTYPEFQYQVKWKENTLIIWDNRALSHYAVNDYWPRKRHLKGVCIRGDNRIDVR